jgi:predicted ArsR family transcriptional regulator
MTAKPRPGALIGAQNRAAVRLYLAAHLGATKADVAQALGLSPMCAGRHVRAIRAEWKANLFKGEKHDG